MSRIRSHAKNQAGWKGEQWRGQLPHDRCEHRQGLGAGQKRWLVAIIGLVVVAAGVMLIAQGVRRTFMKYLMTSRMSAKVRRVVQRLGQIGVTARGVVFAIVGSLVVDAAVTVRPSKSGGLDKALLTLRGEPFGEFLLLLAAVGLVIFGVYGLAEARWRKV